MLESLIQDLGTKVAELEKQKKGARQELEQAREQAERTVKQREADAAKK